MAHLALRKINHSIRFVDPGTVCIIALARHISAPHSSSGANFRVPTPFWSVSFPVRASLGGNTFHPPCACITYRDQSRCGPRSSRSAHVACIFALYRRSLEMRQCRICIYSSLPRVAHGYPSRSRIWCYSDRDIDYYADDARLKDLHVCENVRQTCLEI